MPGPDLGGATRAVAALMDDTCLIQRQERGDVLGRPPGALDETTGEYAPGPAPTQVYDGPCLVTLQREGDGTQPVTAAADVDDAAAGYRLLLPKNAPAVRSGDLVTGTSSVRDPKLPGRRFRVIHPGQVGTYVVARVLTMVELP